MTPLTGGQNILQNSPPREEQRVAAAPRRELGKRLLFWGFLATGINRRQSRAPQGGGPSQEASWHSQGWGRASRAPGAPCCPLAHFWYTGPSGAWIFCDFSWNFLRRLKIHFAAHNKTIQTSLLKTSLVRVSFVQIMQE